MRRLLASGIVTIALAFTACGGQAAPSRTLSVREALSSSPEQTEFESLAVRQDLYRSVARTSQSEAFAEAGSLVLFPVSQGDEFRAAPGFDEKSDLLSAADSGVPLQLAFDGRAEARWPEDRREALQGLSEREAAELVSRTLMAQWGISPEGTLRVDRAPGAPYAVAYVDGILRVNPSFLYLAASVGASVSPVSE